MDKLKVYSEAPIILPEQYNFTQLAVATQDQNPNSEFFIILDDQLPLCTYLFNNWGSIGSDTFLIKLLCNKGFSFTSSEQTEDGLNLFFELDSTSNVEEYLFGLKVLAGDLNQPDASFYLPVCIHSPDKATKDPGLVKKWKFRFAKGRIGNKGLDSKS